MKKGKSVPVPVITIAEAKPLPTPAFMPIGTKVHYREANTKTMKSGTVVGGSPYPQHPDVGNTEVMVRPDDVGLFTLTESIDVRDLMVVADAPPENGQYE